MKKITVLSEGAWGTAIASLLATNNHQVTLWCYNSQVAQEITNTGYNNSFLPNIKLSDLITPATDINAAINSAQWIFEAIPMKFLRSALTQIDQEAIKHQKWVLLTKGIETDSLFLPSQLVTNLFTHIISAVVLSGPSFAYDVARQQFTAVMLASTNNTYALEVQELLTNSYFKTQITDDISGVQVNGAIKNIFALAIGLLDGAGYGENTRAAALTQSLAELALLTHALGGKQETTYGLAGCGDLLLTATSNKSKNYFLGKELAHVANIQTYLANQITFAESINTLLATEQLRKKYNLNLPIAKNLYKIIFQNEPIKALLSELY